MNDMSNITGNGPVTMSSREIAELLEVRHDSVKRTVERLAEKGVIQLPPMVEVTNHLGQTVQEYRICKRDSYVVVAQLSPEFTAKLVDRWQELENTARFAALPNFEDPIAAAQAWIEQKQANNTAIAALEATSKALAEIQPKAEFHDDVASAINAQTFMDVAKVFGTGRTRFTQWLRGKSIVMDNNKPYQRYLDDGYFRVVEKRRKDPSSGEMLTYTQTLVTGKGITYLHKKWAADHDQIGGGNPLH